MGRHAQLIIGAAGSGKSTYATAAAEYFRVAKRPAHVVNLDPAAEYFGYEVALDIRDLISADDVAEELQYGPNGALVFAMQYLADNLSWLRDGIDDIAGGDDAYILFDLPGQVELYTHVPAIKTVARMLSREMGFNVCAVLMMDATFVTDVPKFLSGSLIALSAMVHLELPHVNVLTKTDLVDPRAMKGCLHPCAAELSAKLNDATDTRYRGLNRVIASLLDDFNLVSFLPMSVEDEESVQRVLMHVDNALQYGEDVEVGEMRDPDEDRAERAAAAQG
jgi:GTPase SAR1 family protein